MFTTPYNDESSHKYIVKIVNLQALNPFKPAMFVNIPKSNFKNRGFVILLNGGKRGAGGIGLSVRLSNKFFF
jgi:hypothetical protein